MSDNMTFKKKWENYWFYYKWHTVAAVFIISLIVFFVKDIIFREKYDVMVTMAVQGSVFDDQEQNIKTNLEKYAEDTNGDGKVKVGLNIISYPYNIQTADPQVISALTTRLMSEFTLSDSHIFIFDDTIYDRVFAEQSDIQGFALNFAQAYGAKSGIDGYRYYISKGPLSEGEYVHTLKEEWFIIMRGEENHIVQKNEKSKLYYKQNKNIINNLMQAVS